MLLFWSGALGDIPALEHWVGGVLFRAGLGDGSRLEIHDERGRLEVQILADEVARVFLDGDDVPTERLRREGDRLTVLAADGAEWGTVSLGVATEGGAHAHGGAHADVQELKRRLDERVQDDVATHMAAALSALDPPLLPRVDDALDAAARRAAALCIERVDRSVTIDDPDKAGVIACRVKLDRDDLVEEYTGALESALAEAGTQLAEDDLTRVRRALARASFKLPTLEYRLEP
jgi:hypothetical protein